MRAHQVFLVFLSSLLSHATFARAQITVTDDYYITNDENDLYQSINPPIKITYYGTPAALSASGLEALVKAASDFATMRMRVYFNKNTDPTAYMFDEVQFQAIGVQPRVFGKGRKLRVFEREEADVELQYGTEDAEWKELGVSSNQKNIDLLRAQPYESEERDLQQVIYGQSITLAGNMTFAMVPSAPAQLCNDQLQLEMKRLWGLRSEIIASNHPDLVNLLDYGMMSEVGTFPPSPIPTRSPTLFPTKYPTRSPTVSPTVSPTSSPTFTSMPTTPLPSVGPSISSMPTDFQGSAASKTNAAAVAVPTTFAIIGIAFFLLLKKRKRTTRTKTLTDDKLDEGDEEDGARLLATGAPTKPYEDDASQPESSSGSEIAEESGSGSGAMKQPHTIASNNTMKASNTGKSAESIEKEWATIVSPSSVKGRSVKSSSPGSPGSNLQFPIGLQEENSDEEDDDSDDESVNSNSPLNGALDKMNTSTISATLASVATPPLSVPNRSDSPTMNETLGRYTPTKRSILSPSPSQITKVTPSKVSKEEFEQKDWAVDIPFHWTPEVEKKKFLGGGKKPASKNFENSEADMAGSFPTFDDAEEPPIPPPGSAEQNFESTVGDSSAYSTSLHPGDWSNNGGGTDVEDDTIDERTSKENGASNIRFTMSSETEPFRDNLISQSVESSPGSSKGSSKQLIHDLVWLEKKIADVRARVDRLDGDEFQQSPPMSPSSVGNKSAGSPISANIVCRDIIAPPGKLHIVIHSTKDGPAIHSVKPGSVLENKVFAGDLIMAVNDHDTREMAAEGVMEIMSANSSSQRKLTVIHNAM